MTKVIKSCIFIVLFFYSIVIFAQKEPWTPAATPEKSGSEKVEEEKEENKKNDPDKPLTKKEISKKIKEDEKKKKGEYNKYHDKIQTKKVRKRMKVNEKKSHDTNIHKKPNIFKRLYAKFKKKKRRKK